MKYELHHEKTHFQGSLTSEDIEQPAYLFCTVVQADLSIPWPHSVKYFLTKELIFCILLNGVWTETCHSTDLLLACKHYEISIKQRN